MGDTSLEVRYRLGEEVEAPYGYLFCFKNVDDAQEWSNGSKVQGRGVAILKCKSVTTPYPLSQCLSVFVYVAASVDIRPIVDKFWKMPANNRSGCRKAGTPRGTYGVKKLRVLEVVA